MKKILILHTGGTFGMKLDKDIVKMKDPQNLLNPILQQIPELSSIANIEVKIISHIDSSDSNCELWINISKAIRNYWNEFDGFVVIHGTDTMAWSASACAYFLEGLTKSVVFTGSQRPLSSLRNDARANLIDAVELASSGIPEVMVCFDSQVHRATRVTKFSNEHLHAFKSYNSPLIGKFGVNFKLNSKIAKSILPTAKRHAPVLNLEINPSVGSFVCIPGVQFNSEFIDSILQTFSGIIIQGFGSGNLPLKIQSWTELCQKAFAKKIPVVMTTQCDSGFVNLGLYENGKVFEKLGVLTALDMTFESASLKLMILLGRKIKFEERSEFFSTPLAFECN